MDPIRMDYDDVAWERTDELLDRFKDILWSDGVAHDIALLIQKHRRGIAEKIYNPVSGSSNACLRLRFEDGGSAMIRIAIPGRITMYEKMDAEIAAMRFIADETTIPIPLVLHVGSQAECPGQLGPFMITEYVEHARTLGAALNILGRSEDERPLLDPDIDPSTLDVLYGHMAQLLLKLARPSLPNIGSFTEVDEFEWTVSERPVTFNANAVVQLGDVLPNRLPSQTFTSASAYYCALADLHLEHLTAQHNDAIIDEDDCRRKYVARHLFRKLATEKRLDTFSEYDHGPFKLYCEDLRPENVLLTEKNTVSGVVDWEFTIAAPASFAYSPPWWLLLEHPIKWPWGMDKWEEEYVPRLNVFLDILSAQEDQAIESGTLQDSDRLSTRMRRSWDTGGFWIDYAAQRSFAFDHVYFNRMDEKFFGKVEEGDWLANRLALLTEEQRQGMEPFVRRKMAQKDDRRLADDRFEGLLPMEEDTAASEASS